MRQKYSSKFFRPGILVIFVVFIIYLKIKENTNNFFGIIRNLVLVNYFMYLSWYALHKLLFFGSI